MKLLALDQSSVACGFAVVENNQLRAHGTLRSNKKHYIERCLDIASKVRSLVQEYGIERIVMEKHFYSTMPTFQTAEALGFISSLIVKIAMDAKLKEPARYFNSEMKKIVTGKGKASKDQIRAKVVQYWGINDRDVVDDNDSDALAFAQVWVLKYGERQSGRLDKIAP